MSKETDLTEPTEAEEQLTIAAIGLVINLRGLLKEFESVAAKAEIIPDPNMFSAIEASIHHAHCAIAMKEPLIEIATRFGNQLVGARTNGTYVKKKKTTSTEVSPDSQN